MSKFPGGRAPDVHSHDKSQLRLAEARSFDTTPELLPFIAFLLGDLPSLSGAVDNVCELLEHARLPPGASVLDLGCGRGDIALAVSRTFEARVTGIDAFAPFIARADERARASALDDRCRFVTGDLRSALPPERAFDAVLLIAVGPVLGGPRLTVAELREWVRDDGVMIIDDAYRASDSPPGDAPDGYMSLESTERALTAHGDRIEARRERPASVNDLDARALAWIRWRASALAAERPELADTLTAYVERQVRETILLEEGCTPATWLIRRRAGSSD